MESLGVIRQQVVPNQYPDLDAAGCRFVQDVIECLARVALHELEIDVEHPAQDVDIVLVRLCVFDGLDHRLEISSAIQQEVRLATRRVLEQLQPPVAHRYTWRPVLGSYTTATGTDWS